MGQNLVCPRRVAVGRTVSQVGSLLAQLTAQTTSRQLSRLLLREVVAVAARNIVGTRRVVDVDDDCRRNRVEIDDRVWLVARRSQRKLVDPSILHQTW